MLTKQEEGATREGRTRPRGHDRQLERLWDHFQKMRFLPVVIETPEYMYSDLKSWVRVIRFLIQLAQPLRYH
jgi:hypothetical protein